MIICPKCGEVLTYNSYFGGYLCNNCSWENVSYNIVRHHPIIKLASSATKISLKKVQYATADKSTVLK